MEHEVIFFSGFEQPLEQRGRLIRLAPEGKALILHVEATGERILLGDVRRIAPEALPSLTKEELAVLGAAWSDELLVLCRMAIPYERPQDAGFDMSRLILVCGERAIEAARPGAPLVPLNAQS